MSLSVCTLLVQSWHDFCKSPIAPLINFNVSIPVNNSLPRILLHGTNSFLHFSRPTSQIVRTHFTLISNSISSLYLVTNGHCVKCSLLFPSKISLAQSSLFVLTALPPQSLQSFLSRFTLYHYLQLLPSPANTRNRLKFSYTDFHSFLYSTSRLVSL